MSAYKYRIQCPYCGKGELLADHRTLICVSTFCPICNNKFYASLNTLRGYRAKEIERMRNLRPFYARVKCPQENCKGMLYANGEADVHVVVRCPCKKCRHFYIADLGTLTSTPCRIKP